MRHRYNVEECSIFPAINHSNLKNGIKLHEQIESLNRKYTDSVSYFSG